MESYILKLSSLCPFDDIAINNLENVVKRERQVMSEWVKLHLKNFVALAQDSSVVTNDISTLLEVAAGSTTMCHEASPLTNRQHRVTRKHLFLYLQVDG